jgi:hypothetical protein
MRIWPVELFRYFNQPFPEGNSLLNIQLSTLKNKEADQERLLESQIVWHSYKEKVGLSKLPNFTQSPHSVNFNLSGVKSQGFRNI